MGSILYHDGSSSKQVMNILIKNGTPYRFYKETDDAYLYINDKYDIITLWKK
jgi:hypothetical protein